MKKIVLIILVSGLAMFTKPNNSINQLNKCFQQSGAKLTATTVCGWAELDYGSSPEELASELCSHMGFIPSSQGVYINGMYSLSVSLESKNITVKTRYLENTGTTYAYLEYSQYKDIMNINNISKRVIAAFDSYSVKPYISVMLQGCYDSIMTSYEMEKTADRLMRTADAEYVDGMSGNSLVSVCAFSHSLPACQERSVSGRGINLNIALRACRSYDCTYILIGYPIITIEY